MSVYVRWDNEGRTVMCYDFVGEWSWEEVFVACQQSHAMWLAVEHTVHVIIDMRYGVPFYGDSVPYLRLLSQTTAPLNLGMVVAVGVTEGMQRLWKTLRTITGVYWRNRDLCFVPTLQEARALTATTAPDRPGARESSRPASVG